MNILQSIIKKIKNTISEMKFKRSLCSMIDERERFLQDAKDDFETNIAEGNAEDAFYAWKRIKMCEEHLKEAREFSKHLYSNIPCEAA